MDNNVVKKIRETINKHNMISAGDRLIAGLSGGPDSLCLFDVLCGLAGEMKFELEAVHVNHKFRPGDAEEDQKFVEGYCRERGISCNTFVVDCNELAAREGLTSEEAGRRARYESFDTIAGAHEVLGFDREKIKIVVAQNRNDQAETILFRIMRGAGAGGLCGMDHVSRDMAGYTVIRPLLDVERSEIEKYCAEAGLEPRIDKTNAEPLYTRNKIRLDLIPYINKRFGIDVEAALVRLGENVREDAEYLDEVSEKAYKRAIINGQASGYGSVSRGPDAGMIDDLHFMTRKSIAFEEMDNIDNAAKQIIKMDRKLLAEMAPAIRHRVMMKSLRKCGLEQDVERVHLLAADGLILSDRSSGSVDLPGGYVVRIVYDEVHVRTGRDRNDRDAGDDVAEGHDKGTVPGLIVKEKSIWEMCGQIPCSSVAVFDKDKVPGGEIVLRTRREGDYMRLNAGKKTLQNIFVDMKVPRHLRDVIYVAAVGSEVLWITPGAARPRFAEKYGVSKDTKMVILLEIAQ